MNLVFKVLPFICQSVVRARVCVYMCVCEGVCVCVEYGESGPFIGVRVQGGLITRRDGSRLGKVDT